MIYNYQKNVNLRKIFLEIKNDPSLANIFSGKVNCDGITTKIEMLTTLNQTEEASLDGIVSSHDISDIVYSDAEVKVESSLESATSKASEKAKVEIDSANLIKAKYEIKAYCEYRGKAPAVQILVNGEIVSEITNPSIGWSPFSFYDELGELSGANNIKIVFKADNTRKPTEVRRAKLILRRIS